jgi:hypothetical protein
MHYAYQWEVSFRNILDRIGFNPRGFCLCVCVCVCKTCFTSIYRSGVTLPANLVYPSYILIRCSCWKNAEQSNNMSTVAGGAWRRKPRIYINYENIGLIYIYILEIYPMRNALSVGKPDRKRQLWSSRKLGNNIKTNNKEMWCEGREHSG